MRRLVGKERQIERSDQTDVVDQEKHEDIPLRFECPFGINPKPWCLFEQLKVFFLL